MDKASGCPNHARHLPQLAEAEEKKPPLEHSPKINKTLFEVLQKEHSLSKSPLMTI